MYELSIAGVCRTEVEAFGPGVRDFTVCSVGEENGGVPGGVVKLQPDGRLVQHSLAATARWWGRTKGQKA